MSQLTESEKAFIERIKLGDKEAILSLITRSACDPEEDDALAVNAATPMLVELAKR